MNESYINDEVTLETAIVLLQILKDQFFKKDTLHITLKRCLDNKIKDRNYYLSQHKLMEENLYEGIIEAEIEKQYWESYNPPRRRDIYFKTFKKIKEKAWIKLKKEYIEEAIKDSQRLHSLLNKNGNKIISIVITTRKIKSLRTKWKSNNQRENQSFGEKKLNLKFGKKMEGYNNTYFTMKSQQARKTFINFKKDPHIQMK
jgi:hypothetical protein